MTAKKKTPEAAEGGMSDNKLIGYGAIFTGLVVSVLSAGMLCTLKVVTGGRSRYAGFFAGNNYIGFFENPASFCGCYIHCILCAAGLGKRALSKHIAALEHIGRLHHFAAPQWHESRHPNDQHFVGVACIGPVWLSGQAGSRVCGRVLVETFCKWPAVRSPGRLGHMAQNPQIPGQDIDALLTMQAGRRMFAHFFISTACE